MGNLQIDNLIKSAKEEAESGELFKDINAFGGLCEAGQSSLAAFVYNPTPSISSTAMVIIAYPSGIEAWSPITGDRVYKSPYEDNCISVCSVINHSVLGTLIGLGTKTGDVYFYSPENLDTMKSHFFLGLLHGHNLTITDFGDLELKSINENSISNIGNDLESNGRAIASTIQLISVIGEDKELIVVGDIKGEVYICSLLNKAEKFQFSVKDITNIW